MTKNTLFISVDDTPIPKEVEPFCQSLDCRCTNDFYSFAGDALLGDLKDSDGTPYYRIISPAGRMISEFEKSNKESFNCILKNWNNLLVHLIQDTDSSSILNFSFPIEFANWLQTNNNEYISYVGDELSNHENSIVLSRVDVINEIVINKISRIITQELTKTNYKFIVFSNSYITSESSVKSNLPVDFRGTHFITFTQLIDWGQLIEERRTILKNNLTYDKFYNQNESFINQKIEDTFEKVMTGLEFIQGYAFFANFTLWKRDKIGELFEDDDFLHTFFESEKNLADIISVKVQAFREESEFKIFNEYENKICNILGVDFISVPQQSFKDYYFPIDYHTAIRQFIEIIVDFNENDTGEYVFNSIDSFINNKPNDSVEELKRSLKHYYKFYCLCNLKESLNRIWSVYEEKKESSKESKESSGCYITTAMCNYLGKKDDCYELTMLRGFRDNWLYYQIDGERLIQEYYKYAPIIVDRINNASDKESTYKQIENCIYTCLSYIRSQQFEMAKNLYIVMIRYLADKYLIKN